MQATLDNISIPELKAVVLTHQKMFAQQPGIMNSRFKVVGECGRGVTRVAKTSGCALSGFVLVKKVPGTLHFLAKSSSHSFDHGAMNMSHVVHYWCTPAPASARPMLLLCC